MTNNDSLTSFTKDDADVAVTYMLESSGETLRRSVSL